MAAKSQNKQNLLDRRTLTVWTALLVSLSIVSGLLFALDPTPYAPAVGRVLTVIDPSPSDLQSLLTTRNPISENRWRAIVIHHSGQSRGNAETIGKLHQSQGLGGLGYHFVIGNGDGAYDGEIQAGYRWDRQVEGEWVSDAISICLVGNGDLDAPSRVQREQLVKLVTALQKQLNVPAEKVFLHRDLVETSSPGWHFPAGWFRKQLINSTLAGS